MTLVKSSNPVIKRTFDVPSWFTFRQLHYTIQYAMGPWQCCHLHEFMFATGEVDAFWRPTGEKLKIMPQDLLDDNASGAPKEAEENLKLSAVYGAGAPLRDLIFDGRKFAPLYYLYDFGDNWLHKLVFKGPKLARAARPLFSLAIGCGPVEDSGSVYGWQGVKEAFASRNPTQEQRNLIRWAKERSGLGDNFDPERVPNVVQMNYEGRWENHLISFMESSGEHVPRGFHV
ncbi:hypothetical protein AX16_005919 [Volvariella volvacea WC 439]|nr:hypothetical protein AX16_005919 [Volvariella volvacea WC 439]